MLEELVKQALVGTTRSASQLPPPDGALREAIGWLPPSAPEVTLLQRAAIFSAYVRCGCKPQAVDLPQEDVPPSRLPECSVRASQVLDMLLASPDTPFNQKLIAEWFGYAVSAHQRVAHRLLPRVLEYASHHRALREVISPAIDTRGEWLMKLNPSWQFAAAGDADVDELWNTGNPEQRISAIRQLRRVDPARARSLIGSTWNEDTADDRAAFIESLSVALGPDDEVLLESALDDKSKRVRAAAAELLTALPQSAFVQRMTERAVKLLKFNPAEPGRLLKLKKARPATLEVTLPPETFDKAWARDGISEKPAEAIGLRQWWLLQIVSYVPVDTWTRLWNVPPEECIAAAGDFAEVLIRAWELSAKRTANQAWLRQLSLSAAANGMERFDVSLLENMTPDAQLEVLTSIAKSPKIELETLGGILGASRCELDQQCTLALADTIEYHLSTQAATYRYHLAPMLQNLVLRVPPQMHDALAARWADPKWEVNRKSLDEFFQALVLRRDMKREFSK